MLWFGNKGGKCNRHKLLPSSSFGKVEESPPKETIFKFKVAYHGNYLDTFYGYEIKIGFLIKKSATGGFLIIDGNKSFRIFKEEILSFTQNKFGGNQKDLDEDYILRWLELKNYVLRL